MFYVIEISTGDPSIAGKAIYEHATLTEATAVFHQKLSTALKSDMYESELVMVIDQGGIVLNHEYYADLNAERGTVESEIQL